MNALTIRSASPSDAEQITELIFGVLFEYGLRPDPTGTDADLADLERHYLASGGHFWVVESEGRVVGSCALFPLDDQTVELRKMYLHPSARGQGMGHRLLQLAVDTARADGYAIMRLETATVLREAIALYSRFGFERLLHPPDVPRCDQLWSLKL